MGLVRAWAQLAAALLSATHAYCGPDLFSADPEFLIETWKTEEGLPEDSATAAVQTPDGYLWFGTFNGLVRFNGREFAVFDPYSTPGMPDAGVVSLHFDKLGRMWVSTLAGLGWMEAGKWRSLNPGDAWRGDYVRSFAERANGDILLTSFHGLVAEYTGKEFNPLTPPTEPGKGCLGYADEDGRWWVVQGKFAGTWDGTQWTAIPAFVNAPDARGCGPARDGGMWLLSGSDLIKLRHGAEVSRRRVDGNAGDFWSLSEDSRGNVWISSGDSGLFQVTGSGQTKHWTSSNGLSAKSTRFVFEDRERSLWIGTNNGGLQQFTPRRFRIFPTDSEGQSAFVSSVCSGPSGTVWAATYGEGLFKFDGEGLVPVPLPVESGRPLHLQSVLEDRGGRLWIGSIEGKLIVIEDGKTRLIPAEETGSGNCIALFEDSHGEVWVSGGDSVAAYRDGKFHPFNDTNGLPRGAVTSFAEDDAGGIWAAHKEGIFRFADGRFTAVRDSKGNAFKQVNCLSPGDGAMWAGSATGELMCWRQGNMKPVKMPADHPLRAIQGIVSDGLGWFWIATGRGMLRVSVNELTQAAETPGSVIHWNWIDRSDGLSNAGFSSGRQPVSTQLKDGTLWFATPRGVAMTHPKSFQLNLVPPGVQIEAFSHFQSTRGEMTPSEFSSFRSPVILPPGDRNLEFRCAALSFKSPGNVRCQMMLEGQDTEWQEMPHRAATFFDLPPKDYVFRFRAANADGVWSESDARLAFTIPPHLWETLWFRGGCALLLVAAGAAVALWIIKLRHVVGADVMEIHRQQDEIAHLSRVATLNELSGSLAHELNQPLAIILSNAQAAQRLLERNPSAVEELHEILTDIVAEDRRAGEFIQRLRAMLRRGASAFRPENATAIVEDVLTLIRSDLINRGVTVNTGFGPGLQPVMADRIQIQQVLLNLITNACDSMASNERNFRRLGISTSEVNNQVLVRVTDEGCGLPAGEPERVFKPFFTTKDYGLGMGLAICRTIVNAHNGHLSAEPNSPRGTVFQLALPVATCT